MPALDAARAFLGRAKRRYPAARGLMYGSRARGDARPDSDVDVAIILDEPGAVARRAGVELAAEAFDMMLETGLLVAPLAVSADDWATPECFSNPFLIYNIRRDGIAL